MFEVIKTFAIVDRFVGVHCYVTRLLSDVALHNDHDKIKT